MWVGNKTATFTRTSWKSQHNCDNYVPYKKTEGYYFNIIHNYFNHNYNVTVGEYLT